MMVMVGTSFFVGYLSSALQSTHPLKSPHPLVRTVPTTLTVPERHSPKVTDRKQLRVCSPHHDSISELRLQEQASLEGVKETSNYQTFTGSRDAEG